MYPFGIIDEMHIFGVMVNMNVFLLDIKNLQSLTILDNYAVQLN